MSDSELPARPPAADQKSTKATTRRDRTRIIAAVIIGGLVTAFALLNLNDVKVDWLIGTGQTPLIVVIALAFALGILTDRLVIFRARRRQRTQSRDVKDP